MSKSEHDPIVTTPVWARPVAAAPAVAPSPRTHIALRSANLPLDTAVQLFGAFSGPKMAAEQFAGAVVHLAATASEALPKAAPGADPSAHSFAQLGVQEADAEQLPAALASMTRIAVELQAQGRLPEAEALLRQALATLLERFGAQDPHVLRSQNALACLLQSQGKYLDARRLYLQTVELQRRLLGPDHLETVATMENLGTLLYEQGELDNAAPLMREAVTCRRRLLGDAHADTLRSFNNLALLLQKQGDLAGAESLLRQTLSGQVLTLGKDHAETLTTLANLAIVLEDRGQLDASEAMHRQSLRQRSETLGEHHLDTLTSANNLAAFLMEQGRPVEAAELLQATVQRAQSVMPSGHFFYANLQARYGTCLSQIKAYGDAETQLVEGYTKLKEVLGAVHQRTQRACRALVSLYQQWGKPAQAAVYRAALRS